MPRMFVRSLLSVTCLLLGSACPSTKHSDPPREANAPGAAGDSGGNAETPAANGGGAGGAAGLEHSPKLVPAAGSGGARAQAGAVARADSAGSAGVAPLAGTSAPPAQQPQNPPETVPSPPRELWRPAAGATPTNPRYVYLLSDASDPVAGGQSHTYTQANATLNLDIFSGRVEIVVAGAEGWHGLFDTASALVVPPTGFFEAQSTATDAPLQSLDRPALLWSSVVTQPCAAVSGWFAIDELVFTGNLLSALELRFEQHCDSASAALRGQLHWAAFDPTIPPGPSEPPAGLWAKLPEPVPTTGNYVYLESEPGDVIGAGQSATYPFAASALENDGALVDIAFDDWAGHFIAMRGHNQLERGYYGELQRWPAYDPVKGGLAWSTSERVCATLSGWFVVDQVQYVADHLTALDLRFEQHCNEAAAALHGRVHFAQ
ncbi:MAG: hypothetical protein RL701_2815 [Pseudomonadota bacterium]